MLQLGVKRRDLQSRAFHHERERLHRDGSVGVEKVVSFAIPLVEPPASVTQRQQRGGGVRRYDMADDGVLHFRKAPRLAPVRDRDTPLGRPSFLFYSVTKWTSITLPLTDSLISR